MDSELSWQTLKKLGNDLTAPIASEAHIGSTVALEAIRTAFPCADGPMFTVFGIPVYVDPRIGYDNFEIWDQYGNVMIRLKVL